MTKGKRNENETNYPKQIVEYQPWKYEYRMTKEKTVNQLVVFI